MLNGCSIKAFEGGLSDLVRKNYHFDCIFDCWRVTIVEKHIRQLPLVTDFLVYSLLVFGLIRISNIYEYLFKLKKNLHAPLINLNSSNDKHPHQNSNMPCG